jgi:hypothetical protein
VPNHIDDARVVACYLLKWQGRPWVGPHQDGPHLRVVEGGPCKGASLTADARGAAANVVVPGSEQEPESLPPPFPLPFPSLCPWHC